MQNRPRCAAGRRSPTTRTCRDVDGSAEIRSLDEVACAHDDRRGPGGRSESRSEPSSATSTSVTPEARRIHLASAALSSTCAVSRICSTWASVMEWDDVRPWNMGICRDERAPVDRTVATDWRLRTWLSRRARAAMALRRGRPRRTQPRGDVSRSSSRRCAGRSGRFGRRPGCRAAQPAG